MNVQIRSMFDTEPTSAELTSSRQRFAKRPFHQRNTQSSNPTLWKRMALETRTHNETHPRSRRTAPQESGDNSPEHGGMPKPKGGTAEKKGPPSFLPPPCGKTHPTALKHLPRTRAKPLPQRWLLTSALYPQATMYRKKLSNPRARFDRTDVPHKAIIGHDNLHPMSPTKHMD